MKRFHVHDGVTHGLVWAAFLTVGDSTTYGGNPDLSQLALENAAAGGCCTPGAPQGVYCPPKAHLAPEAPCCAAEG